MGTALAQIGPPALGFFGIMILDLPGFLRLLGSFGFSIKVVSRGPGASNDVLHGCHRLASAGQQRSVNLGPLTLLSGGPCDRGNRCPGGQPGGGRRRLGPVGAATPGALPAEGVIRRGRFRGSSIATGVDRPWGRRCPCRDRASHVALTGDTITIDARAQPAPAGRARQRLGREVWGPGRVGVGALQRGALGNEKKHCRTTS